MKRICLICCAVLMLICCAAGCDSQPESAESYYTAHARELAEADKLSDKTEPKTEAPTEAVTDPVTEEVTEPVTEAVTEPAAEPESSEIPQESEYSESEMTYVLNTNTHKFHYPDCSSVKDIKDKNREDFTGARSEVINRGFEPCKRCNP